MLFRSQNPKSKVQNPKSEAHIGSPKFEMFESPHPRLQIIFNALQESSMQAQASYAFQQRDISDSSLC